MCIVELDELSFSFAMYYYTDCRSEDTLFVLDRKCGSHWNMYVMLTRLMQCNCVQNAKVTLDSSRYECHLNVTFTLESSGRGCSLDATVMLESSRRGCRLKANITFAACFAFESCLFC